MGLSIYTAAAWSRREEIHRYAYRLQWLGYEITSRWLTADQETLRGAAEMDAADLKRADAILLFNDPQYFEKEPIAPSLLSCARMVELGMALAWRKQVFVVGGQQNAFQFLPQVQMFPTFEEFVSWLSVWHGLNPKGGFDA